MRNYILLTATVSACLLGGNAFAGGAPDSITGEYTRAGCNGCQPGDELGQVSHRLLTAHEADDKHRQKGSLLSWNDEGRWFEIDFNDSFNTCVNIYEDGKARIGGVVNSGNGPQVGRVFGFYMEDNGEPAYFSDLSTTVRFTLDYMLVEAARQYLQFWCQTGNLPGDPLPGYAVWPAIVIDGNFVVHNSLKDGD